MNAVHVEVPFGAQNLIIESGKLAKQAHGAVTVTCGGTTVLVAVCMAKKPKAGQDFFPLMVEYQEKTYAAGRIPGGFFKREGRPTQKEILTARLIDRPLRPLFPEGFLNDVQVTACVLSSDGANDPDVLALVGASAALTISDIPFAGPVAAVRVGIVEGKMVLNPTFEEREKADLDFVVAGQADGVVMIEGEAKEVPERQVSEALEFAAGKLGAICQLQKDLAKKIGKPKTKVTLTPVNEKLLAKVKALAEAKVKHVYQIADKLERQKAHDELKESLIKDLAVYDECKIDEKDSISEGKVLAILEQIEYAEVRRRIFVDNRRSDGRGLKDIREISCEVEVLQRTHGSSLFVRGQTQSLTVVTLGTKRDEQLIEALEGTSYQNFMLHYNFPSFSVGEVKPARGPGRREIGHGALAAKAIQPMLPGKENFPYTIRVVSEILESNGSSSMATVCASSLALMDAGVPIKHAVAGISIGLVTKDDKTVLLTDIMGLEDHFGDMDFKVAGTESGVTAIQLDLKIAGVSLDLLNKALTQAREARLSILNEMKNAISKPREQISVYAPKITFCQVPVDKIGEVIGPGGKMIKKIMEQTGCTSIDIDDDGKVLIASTDRESGQKALDFINGMMEEPIVGRVYDGVVKRIMNFGAFVEFLPGREGLVHVSEMSKSFVKDINEVVKIGDRMKVKLIEIDKMKRLNLSKKQAEEV